MTLGEVKYKLIQVHFHRPSEHTIGGRSFAMEAHFVHRADGGTLAAVCVLMATGRELYAERASAPSIMLTALARP